MISSQKQNLINHLMNQGYLKTREIIKAFKEVPREDFVPEKYKDHAYSDYPLSIGSGQTISAPHMAAIMTELLEPRKTDKILEIGSGSGYQAAILSRLVKKVYGIELIPELAEFARKNLEKLGYKNVEIINSDGSNGYAKAKPYDKIIITCAISGFPEKLIEQLKENGKIIAPIGGGWHQILTIGTKKKGNMETKTYGACVFVPMRH